MLDYDIQYVASAAGAGKRAGTAATTCSPTGRGEQRAPLSRARGESGPTQNSAASGLGGKVPDASLLVGEPVVSDVMLAVMAAHCAWAQRYEPWTIRELP